MSHLLLPGSGALGGFAVLVWATARGCRDLLPRLARERRISHERDRELTLAEHALRNGEPIDDIIRLIEALNDDET